MHKHTHSLTRSKSHIVWNHFTSKNSEKMTSTLRTNTDEQCSQTWFDCSLQASTYTHTYTHSSIHPQMGLHKIHSFIYRKVMTWRVPWRHEQVGEFHWRETKNNIISSIEQITWTIVDIQNACVTDWERERGLRCKPEGSDLSAGLEVSTCDR